MFRAQLVPAVQIVGAAVLSRAVSLLHGRSVLGRDCLSHPQPPTASRDSLRFDFDEGIGELRVVAVGKAPCWVAPAADPTALVPIPPGSPGHALHDGDVLTLSADSGLCRVTIDAPPPPPFPPYTAPPPLGPGAPNEGLQALVNAVKRAGTTGAAVNPLRYYQDGNFLVLYDQYPKSKVHLLIIPRDPKVTDLTVLTASNVPMLREMVALGERIVAHLRATQFPKTVLICGFHGIPSLRPLHMHLLSLDLSTPFMKKKKHYNGFATNFFLGAPGVLRELETTGRVGSAHDRKTLEALEHGPMTCVWCERPLKDMGEVKAHLPICPRNGAEVK